MMKVGAGRSGDDSAFSPRLGDRMWRFGGNAQAASSDVQRICLRAANMFVTIRVPVLPCML